MVKLGEDDRLVLPAGYRKAMGIAAGDTLILRFADRLWMRLNLDITIPCIR